MINVLPDAIIGVGRHGLVEIAPRQRGDHSKLEEEANRLLDDYRREGEAHARFTGDDLRGTTAVFKDNQAARIVKKFERKFGDIHEEIQP